MPTVKSLYSCDRGTKQIALDEKGLIWFRQRINDSHYGQQWTSWTILDLDPRHWEKEDKSHIRIKYSDSDFEKYYKNKGGIDSKLASALELIIR